MNMTIIAILLLLIFSINTDCLGMNMNSTQDTLVKTKDSLSNLKNNLEALKKSLKNLSEALENPPETKTELDTFIEALTSGDNDDCQKAIDELAHQLENGDESTYDDLLKHAQESIASIDEDERYNGFSIIRLMIDTKHEKPQADALQIANKAIAIIDQQQDGTYILDDLVLNGYNPAFQPALEWANKLLTFTGEEWYQEDASDIFIRLIEQKYEPASQPALEHAKHLLTLTGKSWYQKKAAEILFYLTKNSYQKAYQPTLELAQKLATRTGKKWHKKAVQDLFKSLAEAIDDILVKAASGDRTMGNLCLNLIQTINPNETPQFFQTVLVKAKTLVKSPHDHERELGTQLYLGLTRKGYADAYAPALEWAEKTLIKSPHDPERELGTQLYFGLISKGYSDAYAPAHEWAEKLLTMTGQKWYHDAASGFFNGLVHHDYKLAFYDAITAVASPDTIYAEQDKPTTWSEVYFNTGIRVKDMIDLLNSKGYVGNHSVVEKIQEYLATPIQGSDWSYRHSAGLWLLTILIEHKFQQGYPILKDPATINAFKGLLHRGPMDIDSKIENPCIGFLHTLKDAKPEGRDAFFDAARDYIKSSNQHDSSTKQWCEMIEQALNS